MRTYQCACRAKLFFGNTRCASCQRNVGWCDACQAMTSLSTAGKCERPGCGQALVACLNREKFAVCSVFVPADAEPLCRSCRRTKVIPDTSQPVQIHQWRIMESGKRLLLYDLALVGITEELLDRDPPLVFRFMADTAEQRIMTGHENGVITINLAEADPVVREQGRQQFGEPHRTVIGHLRHEVSHFLWQQLVQEKPDRERDCRGVFGDHTNPTYQQSLERYYKQGPPANWATKFISQYATAHPWEDFAETAAFYLDMRSVLDTLACQVPALAAPAEANFDGQLQAYLKAGIAINEINRSLGLTDLVPEVISTPVVEKLRYVHRLLSSAAASPTTGEPTNVAAAGSPPKN